MTIATARNEALVNKVFTSSPGLLAVQVRGFAAGDSCTIMVTHVSSKKYCDTIRSHTSSATSLGGLELAVDDKALVSVVLAFRELAMCPNSSVASATKLLTVPKRKDMVVWCTQTATSVRGNSDRYAMLQVQN